jgi:hypothetical protein
LCGGGPSQGSGQEQGRSESSKPRDGTFRRHG